MAFALFSKLPIELRYSIWTFALPDPRIIEVASSDSDSDSSSTLSSSPTTNGEEEEEEEEEEKEVTLFVKSAIDPALLFTCQESRHIALRTYHLSFASQLRHPVYLDPARDTLLMANLETLVEFVEATLKSRRDSEVPTEEERAVQFFAVDLYDLTRHRNWESSKVVWTLEKFVSEFESMIRLGGHGIERRDVFILVFMVATIAAMMHRDEFEML